MEVGQLISLAIPVLSPHDNADKALQAIEQVNTPHLAVVADGQYLGMISEAVLLAADPDTLVSELPYFGQAAHINASRHVFDLYLLAQENQLDVVPVTGADDQFVGCVLVSDALRNLAKTYSFQHTGGILILSVYERDYSINYLSRLIEGDNLKILASFIDQDPDDPQRLFVTLKLNQADLTRTIATFERFGIEVHRQYHSPEAISIDQDRFGQLMRYLNV